MKQALVETLEGLEIGEPVSRGPLHLFPLVGGPDEGDGPALLAEALEGGSLLVEELGEEGSVPELRVINRRGVRVLILEGDELVGAKQNRTVNSTVLIAADSELVLPVSCVERGRWSRRSRTFASNGATPHLSLRHLKSRSVHDSLRRGRGHRSDQGAVWREVDRVAFLHGAPSPTEALQDTRAGISERLAAFDDLPNGLPGNTRGVVVGLGDAPVMLEVLPGPRTFAKVVGKLLAGYSLEALEHERNGGPPDPSDVEGFVARVASAPHETHEAVGEGTDVRFTTGETSGYALVADGRLLHAAAFAG